MATNSPSFVKGITVRRRVDASLWDMDMTMINSETALAAAWKTWGSATGISGQALTDILHNSRGKKVEQYMSELLGASDNSDLRQFALDPLYLQEQAKGWFDLQTRAAAENMESISVIPGAQELFNSFPSMRRAIYTATREDLARARLLNAGFHVEDTFIVDGDSVRKGKPDAEGYVKAAAWLGASLERCVVFEDAEKGVESGRAAGAFVVAIRTSCQSDDELRKADVIVDDLSYVRLEATGIVCHRAAIGPESNLAAEMAQRAVHVKGMATLL